MFFLLSKFLEFLLNPIFVFLAVILIALIRKNKTLVYCALGFIIFMATPITSNICLKWLEDPKALSNIQQPFDLAIVLGGVSYFDDQDSSIIFRSSADRFLQAMRLQKQGLVKALIFSGGSGYINDTSQVEAKHIQNFLHKLNYEPTVFYEPYSRNTYENAINSIALMNKENLKAKKILIISSSSHLRRARGCFEKAGLQVETFVTDRRFLNKLKSISAIIPSSSGIQNWEIILHETVGMLAYKLKGYI